MPQYVDRQLIVDKIRQDHSTHEALLVALNDFLNTLPKPGTCIESQIEVNAAANALNLNIRYT